MSEGPPTQSVSQYELTAANDDCGDIELGIGSDSRELASAPRESKEIVSRNLSRTLSRNMSKNEPDTTHKIKFKRAKKLQVGKQYMKVAQNLAETSKFSMWSKLELAELLVSQSIELRTESEINRQTLEDLCEALYKGRDMPAKPKMPSLFDMIIRSVMARRIQNLWIFYQAEQRIHSEIKQNELYISKMANMNQTDMDEIGQAEIMYMDNHEEINIQEIEEEQKENNQDDTPDLEAGLASEQDAAVQRVPSRNKMTRLPSQSMGKKSVNVLDLPWTPPDLQKAKLYADYVQPRKGGKGGTLYQLCKTTTGRHCYSGGCGEQFDAWEEGQISEFGIYGSGVTNYFKFMKWAGWTFFILAVCALPSLVLNIYGPNESNNGLKELAKTTAGNLYPSTNSTADSLHIPGCYGYDAYNIQCSLDKFRLAQFYSGLDILISIILFLAFLWLRKFERKEDQELNKNTVNASMFTIMMYNIPGDLTDEALIAHFRHLLREHVVSTVSIAYDNADEIRECTRRGDLIRAKVRLVHEHRYNCTMIRKTKREDEVGRIIDKKREEFFERMKRINAELKKKEELLETYAALPSKALYAFVTFDKVAGKAAAMHIYNNRTLYQRVFPSPSLMINGKMPRVYDAPEPSTIIWENLHFTRTDRTLRRLFSTVSSLILVAFSLVIIFGSKYLQETSLSKSVNEAVCPVDFNSQTEENQINAILADPDLTHCYCDQLSTLEQSTNDYCKSYWRDNLNSQVLTYFASFVVLLVNALIEASMRFSSNFEKHHTEDSKGKSVFIRLFLLKYINTSAIFLINNNNVILKALNVTVSTSIEFTADWFNTIGVTIILVQLGDVFISHGNKLYQYYVFRRRKNKAQVDAAKTLTQDELNKLYVGPNFEFAFNYAQLSSTLFVCLTFSTGIPLLYAVAATNFLVFYFVEKYLFIHLYRIPPHFNSHIGKRATSLVPVAIIIHICMSIWMLSNEQLFDNPSYGFITSSYGFGESLRKKVSGKATFQLFVLLIVMCFLLLLSLFVKQLSVLFNRFLVTCCGHCFKQKQATEKKATVKSVISYSRAVQRNLIKGLKNYNILHNPHYKDAFAITWKFAFENKTVRSVRQMKSKAQASAEEDDAAKIEALQRKFVAVAEQQHHDNPGGRALQRTKSANRGFSQSFYVPTTVPAPMVNNITPAPSAKDNDKSARKRAASPSTKKGEKGNKSGKSGKSAEGSSKKKGK